MPTLGQNDSVIENIAANISMRHGIKRLEWKEIEDIN